jgi:hypothetical protein
VIELLGSSSVQAVQRYRAEILDSQVPTLADVAIEWIDAQVDAPEGLRLLKTWWCEIGQQRRPGGGPFLLREVAAAISAGTLPDAAIVATVNSMRRDWQAGSLLLPTLKLVRHGSDFQIADANRRATAILLSGDRLVVPAVLIGVPAHCTLSAC